MVEKRIETVAHERTNDARFNLVEVPTESGVFIRDGETDTILDDKAALAQILNIVEEIKRSLV